MNMKSLVGQNMGISNFRKSEKVLSNDFGAQELRVMINILLFSELSQFKKHRKLMQDISHPAF